MRRRAWIGALWGGLSASATLLATRRAAAGPFDVGDSGWEGGSELYAIAKAELGAERVKAVAVLDWSQLRPEDGLLVMHPEQSLDASEATEFMKQGGRLAVLDDFGAGTELLRRFKIERVPMPGKPIAALRNNPELPIAEPWLEVQKGQIGAPHPVVSNVKQLVLNHPTALEHPDLSPVLKVRISGGQDAVVAVAGQVGRGRLFAMSDPSSVINSMLRYPGNRAYAAGLVRYLASDSDRTGGRLFLLTNRFDQEGSIGGERTLGQEIESLLRSLAESLQSARRLGLPPWLLMALSAASVILLGTWVFRSSGKPYRSPLPRYARPVPLVSRGGVAGRFAMLAAPTSPRSLALLELKSALFEAVALRFNLGPSPNHEVVLSAVSGSGKVSPPLKAQLREVVARMNRAEAAVLSGSGIRVPRPSLEESHRTVMAVLDAIEAVDLPASGGPSSGRAPRSYRTMPDPGSAEPGNRSAPSPPP